MSQQSDSESRKLLGRLRDTMAEDSEGQARLNKITHLIADAMSTEVCSIYLFRDEKTLELCATEGLNAEAVHKTRMKLGEGLVGRVAERGNVVNTAIAPAEKGFRFMPETGEEIYSSFLGIPIQRLGQGVGVLVVQSKAERKYTSDEVYGLEVVAMVLAEMTELGAFVGEGAALRPLHQEATMFRGTVAQEGAVSGYVWLHEPRVVVTNLIAEDTKGEKQRLDNALKELRLGIDELLNGVEVSNKEPREVLEAYRMFAHSRGWIRRMETDIDQGLSAEAAVEKEQSSTRARMTKASDAYMRDRLHDLDDLSNRLLRLLTGQGQNTGAEMPEHPILVARNVGPAELLDYGRKLKGLVLEEGSVGSHASIIARALAIPLVIHAENITAEALNGDQIMIDGEQGIVHLRPDESVAHAFKDKMAMQAQAQQRYVALRNEAAISKCNRRISLMMNAGLMADLPSLENSGAEGVGLFRTELQFLLRNQMPRRSELSGIYSKVMDAAGNLPVVFRTLDIGSDKVLPYMTRVTEPNPALGWRAIRVGLDKPGVLRMQLQAFLRGANGRPLTIMFPFVSLPNEFYTARQEMDKAIEREIRLGHPIPDKIKIGAMLETPALAFAPDSFLSDVDFLSIGGNDLKQFFYAADRENELVRKRYDSLDGSYLKFLQHIITRCEQADTKLSYCGEDAGRPIEALCLAAIGINTLSMRPASIGPVKHLLIRTDLSALKTVIEQAYSKGGSAVRNEVNEFFLQQTK
ncbi:MAG: phosphoenolpyruvate--protein phosphotransferase [Paracoccaceae bacterium]|nr:phosphoenolpyruvate--protein phosphotransferase [Paracoccaceae bacterium]